MDFSFSDLNFNSIVTDNVAMLPGIENLPGFETRAAFTVNFASVFRETWILCRPLWMIRSLTFRGEATINL